MGSRSKSEQVSLEDESNLDKKSNFLSNLFTVFKIIGSIAFLYKFSLFELNDSQKIANRELFGNKCQYPGCGRIFKTTPHVHHIIPQAFSSEVLGISPDHATNLVPICDMHHLGHPSFGGESQYGSDSEWNPIHPDNTFASLLLTGKFKTVRRAYIEKYPEIYSYYLAIAEEFHYLSVKDLEKQYPKIFEKYIKLGEAMGVDEISDIVYQVIMRQLRSETMKKQRPGYIKEQNDVRVYWMPKHDPELQIQSIRAVLQAEGIVISNDGAITRLDSNIKKNWRFPLRSFSPTVRAKTGRYVWDSMVAILVEKNLLNLAKSSNAIKGIFAEMRSGKKPSWQVYYDSIYLPAIRGYQNVIKRFRNDMKVSAIVQKYLDSLDESEYKIIVSKYNTAVHVYNKVGEAENKDTILDILNSLFFRPATEYDRRQG